MTQVFEVQIKSQGRIIIPSYFRIKGCLRPGDWVVVQVDKIEKKEACGRVEKGELKT